MSLLTDIAFITAIGSSDELEEMLPNKAAYPTAITTPGKNEDNVSLPYVIVTYDGIVDDEFTKDSTMDCDTEMVQVSVELCAKHRPALGQLAVKVKQVIAAYFDERRSAVDEQAHDDLIPLQMEMKAGPVMYDPKRPCFWQVLTYTCETNID